MPVATAAGGLAEEPGSQERQRQKHAHHHRQRRIQRPQVDENADGRQHRDQELRQVLAIVRFQLLNTVDSAGHQLAGSAPFQVPRPQHQEVAIEARAQGLLDGSGRALSSGLPQVQEHAAHHRGHGRCGDEEPEVAPRVARRTRQRWRVRHTQRTPDWQRRSGDR